VELRSSSVGQIAVLRVIGELDSCDTEMVAAVLGDCLGQRPTHLVVDLTELNFCSVRGMALLVETSWAATAAGIGYSLAGCCAPLTRVMLQIWGDRVPRHFRGATDAIVELRDLPTPRRTRPPPA
jgi:anti-anti-sigma factor